MAVVRLAVAAGTGSAAILTREGVFSHFYPRGGIQNDDVSDARCGGRVSHLVGVALVAALPNGIKMAKWMQQ